MKLQAILILAVTVTSHAPIYFQHVTEDMELIYRF